jgi:hypothetical protein
VVRQSQDLDPSQYLASIFVSFEELQNGGNGNRERDRNRGKKMKSKGLVKDEFIVRGKKASLCCKVTRLRPLVLLLLLV